MCRRIKFRKESDYVALIKLLQEETAKRAEEKAKEANKIKK